jgi:hypothetical protein
LKIGQTSKKFWLGSPKRTDHSRNRGVDWRIILKWILKKHGERMWNGLIWLGIGASGGLLCEHGNEPSGSIKDGEFLD